MTTEEFLREISQEGEEWRDVVGFEGYYMVSNLSRVVSLPRKNRRTTIMKETLNNEGYISMCLSKDGRGFKERLHRIIAKAWIPNPNNYNCIEHLDACKTNNSLSNLRWCNHAMNQNNPITVHRMADNSRKDKTKSMEIICLKDNKPVKIYSHLSKVKEDGCKVSSVWKCLKGYKKHHRDMVWMYLSDYEASNQ